MASQEQLLTELRNSNPVRRRQAIVALGRSKDIRVLPALQVVAKRDSHPALQQLAQKAIRYIQEQTQTMPQLTDADIRKTQQHLYDPDPRPAASSSDEKAPVRRFSVLGNAPRDPHPYESEPQSYTADEYEEEVARRRKERGKARRSVMKDQEDHHVSWLDVGIDLLLLILAQGIGMLIVLLLMPSLLGLPPGETAFGLSVGDMVGQAFLAIVTAVVSVFIRHFILYMITSFLMSGVGTILDINHALIPIEAGVSFLYYLGILFVAAAISPELLDGGPGMFEVLTFTAQNLEAVFWIGIIVVLAIFLFMAYRLGKVLEFSTLTALGALILGWLIGGAMTFFFGLATSPAMVF